jgi:hypothetical protein
VKPRSLSERLLFIVLATGAMYLGSCPASWAADTANILRLMGENSAGHACPISATEALTNKHIAVRGYEWIKYQWSAGNASGVVKTVQVDDSRDLAKVEAIGQAFPGWYVIAKQSPKAGDRVVILGYSWRSKKSAMADDRIEAKVTRVVANHVVFHPSGLGGSSGSCVLNELGEVVAINEGSFPTEDRELAGLAVGVWGELHRIPEN